MRDRPLLAVVALVAALTLALGGAAVYALLRAPTPAGGYADVSIGKARLVLSADYLRFEADRAGGQLDRLDIAARFPAFSPAGAPAKGKATPDAAGRDPSLVFLTLTPLDGSLDPAERPMRLYARFLDPAVWTHPGGLLMRRFLPGAPYEGEELYIAPPEGRAFFARCPIPAAAGDGLPEVCITEIQTAGVSLQMRFPPALLSDWERLNEGARALLRQFAR